MFQKIIDIYKTRKENNLPLFPVASVDYPTIPGDTSNFCTDYLENYSSYDNYIARMWGMRNFDAFLSNSESEAMDEWEEAVIASVQTHIQEWSRLYYALSLHYNPLWNVDGSTETLYGETHRTDEYGETKRTDTAGEKQSTNTDYATAYDSGTEKETGKSVFEDDENTFTVEGDAHTDEFTNDEHTVTETRTGNIGVTSSQALLTAEFEIRKRSFFRTIFKQIIDDCGCYYIEGEWK